jgi:hypothetical protein
MYDITKHHLDIPIGHLLVETRQRIERAEMQALSAGNADYDLINYLAAVENCLDDLVSLTDDSPIENDTISYSELDERFEKLREEHVELIKENNELRKLIKKQKGK